MIRIESPQPRPSRDSAALLARVRRLRRRSLAWPHLARDRRPLRPPVDWPTHDRRNGGDSAMAVRWYCATRAGLMRLSPRLSEPDRAAFEAFVAGLPEYFPSTSKWDDGHADPNMLSQKPSGIIDCAHLLGHPGEHHVPIPIGSIEARDNPRRLSPAPTTSRTLVMVALPQSPQSFHSPRHTTVEHRGLHHHHTLLRGVGVWWWCRYPAVAFRPHHSRSAVTHTAGSGGTPRGGARPARPPRCPLHHRRHQLPDHRRVGALTFAKPPPPKTPKKRSRLHHLAPPPKSPVCAR